MGGLRLQRLPVARQGFAALTVGRIVGLTFECACFGFQSRALPVDFGLSGAGQLGQTRRRGLADSGIGEDGFAREQADTGHDWAAKGLRGWGSGRCLSATDRLRPGRGACEGGSENKGGEEKRTAVHDTTFLDLLDFAGESASAVAGDRKST